MPLPKDIHVRHLRLLRHPDRLGDRGLRRLPEGGRARRLHDRPRRADPAASSRSSARSRAAPTSSTPRSCAAPPSRSPRSWAGSSSRRARSSCPTASRAGCRSARPTRSSSGSRRSTSSGSCRTSTTSCSARRGATSATDFDLVVTAQQVRSYKPDPAHFKECARRIGGKKKAGSTSLGLPDRRRAVPEGEDPGHLGQPPRRRARVRPEEADRGGQDLPRRGQAARPGLGARAAARRAAARHARGLGPHRRDRRHEPVLADERDRAARGRRGDADRLAVLPRRARAAAGAAGAGRLRAERAARDPRRLGPPARAASRSRGWRSASAETTSGESAREPGEAQRELRDYDDAAYVERSEPLSLGEVQALPVPGVLEIGDQELRAASRPTATPRTGWPSGRRGSGARARATTSARSRSPGSTTAARSTTTATRWRGWRRWSSRPTRSWRATGRRRRARRRRARSDAGPRLPRRARARRRAAVAADGARQRPPARDPRRESRSGRLVSRVPSDMRTFLDSLRG